MTLMMNIIFNIANRKEIYDDLVNQKVFIIIFTIHYW